MFSVAMEPDADVPNVRVDMRGLKRFALEKLSSRPLLREIILSEEDSLEPSEFVAKMKIWLKLFSAESRGRF
jgi:hypothetical protein